MDMLNRINASARVSAILRSEQAHADASHEFAAVGEEGARRRHREPEGGEPAAGMDAPAPDPSDKPPESIIERQSLTEVDEVLPEDAHGPQELRAMLAIRL